MRASPQDLTRRLAAGVALAAAACSFDVAGIGGGDDDPAGPDAAPDTPVDAGPCAPGCAGDELTTCPDGEVGAPAVETCDLGCSISGEPHCRELVPSNSVPVSALDGATAALATGDGDVVIVDTDDGGIYDWDDGELEVRRAPGEGIDDGVGFQVIGDHGVLAVDALTIGAGSVVVVEGARPLIVLSRGPVAIHGFVDVAGGCVVGATYARACPGPGGGKGATGSGGDAATGCAPGGNGHYDGALIGGDDETGAGGGGMGQSGASSGASGGHFGAGGSIELCPGATLVPLAGGSGGGAAQLDTPGSSWAHGGGGGGALQVTSLTSIELVGQGDAVAVIDASGAGGGVTDDEDGGGGGGSGGAVLLEAPSITLTQAAVFAGGGGGGAGRPPDSPGNVAPADGNGQAGQWTVAVAAGGVGGGGSGDAGRGGNGGIGGASPVPPKSGGGGVDGTGAGGGGAGRLRINTAPDRLVEAMFVTTALASTGPVQAR